MVTAADLTKQLACDEDINYGSGTVQQLRNGSIRNVSKVTVVKPVSAIVAIKELDTSKFLFAMVAASTGVAFFYYDSTSALAGDDLTVVVPNAGSGRWLRSRPNLAGLPTYADEAAALAGGLAQGDMYATATGELRVKL